MRALFVAAALLWSVATAFAADPVGSYDVQGSNPDGSKYTYSCMYAAPGLTHERAQGRKSARL